VARGLGAWPPDLTGSIRKVHDFLTVGAAAPLQHAGVLALGLPDAYYVQLSQPYAARRDHLVTSLQSIGFNCLIPRGAYYVMTDISSFGFADDASFGAPSDHRRRSGGSARVEFFFECKR
jgi:aspartate/methionine/tyrosine aminotransferase